MPLATLEQPNISIEDAAELCSIVVRHCWFPNPDVVKRLRGAVFPVIRDTGRRMTIGTTENGRRIMYDDNTTPRWALLWSHGCRKTDHPKGWTFAHVWQQAKNPDAYTHVANLVLMPECFASLSDKLGPLVPVLQHHAETVYGWRPVGENHVEAPTGYDALEWNYLDGHPDPRGFILGQLTRLQNERVKLLRELGCDRQGQPTVGG